MIDPRSMKRSTRKRTHTRAYNQPPAFRATVGAARSHFTRLRGGHKEDEDSRCSPPEQRCDTPRLGLRTRKTVPCSPTRKDLSVDFQPDLHGKISRGDGVRATDEAHQGVDDYASLSSVPEGYRDDAMYRMRVVFRKDALLPSLLYR